MIDIDKHNELKTALIDLTKDIIDKIIKIRENTNDEILLAHTLYKRFIIEKYDYFAIKSHNISGYHVDEKRSLYYLKNELKIKNPYFYKNRFRYELSSYGNCISKVATTPYIVDLEKRMNSRYPPDVLALDELDDFILEMHYIIFDRIYNISGINFEYINEIDSFIEDLDNNSRKFRVKAYVTGVKLEDDKYELNNIPIRDSVLILRRPTKYDFDYDKSCVDEGSFAKFNEFEFISKTSAIIEFETVFVRQSVVQPVVMSQIHAIINILNCLYLGQIACIKYTITAEKSFNVKPFVQFYNNKYNYNLSYTFTQSNVIRYNVFFKALIDHFFVMDTFLPTESNLNQPSYYYLVFAFQMYKDALFKSFDKKILTAYAVTSLETLYRNEKRFDNSKYETISNRLYQIYKTFELDISKKDILKNIKDAYDVRNGIYHGYDISKDLLERIDDIYLTTLNYCRISNVIFLKLEMKKDDIINLMITLDMNDNYKNILKYQETRKIIEDRLGKEFIDVIRLKE